MFMAISSVPNRPQFLPDSPSHLMNAASAASKLRFFPPILISRGCFFCTLDLRTENRKARAKEVRARPPEAEEMKENWLTSLSCPFLRPKLDLYSGIREKDEGKWVLGIDPDACGALALLKVDDDDASRCSAQVFDTPYLQVLVGKTVRKRLDARSIVQLLHSFGAPLGTTAYIEQSSPFPQDGKQDDSRKAASDLFPSLSSSLKRKKDHGRAEALLIAAYGKGLRLQPESITTTSSETSMPTLSMEEDRSSDEQCQSHEQKPNNTEVLLL